MGLIGKCSSGRKECIRSYGYFHLIKGILGINTVLPFKLSLFWDLNRFSTINIYNHIELSFTELERMRDGTWYLNLFFILILGHTFCPMPIFCSGFMICSGRMFRLYKKSHCLAALVPFQFRPSSILHIEINKFWTHTRSYVLFQFLNLNLSRKCSDYNDYEIFFFSLFRYFLYAYLVCIFGLLLSSI